MNCCIRESHPNGVGLRSNQRGERTGNPVESKRGRYSKSEASGHPPETMGRSIRSVGAWCPVTEAIDGWMVELCASISISCWAVDCLYSMGADVHFVHLRSISMKAFQSAGQGLNCGQKRSRSDTEIGVCNFGAEDGLQGTWAIEWGPHGRHLE